MYSLNLEYILLIYRWLIKLLNLAIISFFTNVSLGIYLVCIAWIAAESDYGLVGVGLVFAAGSLANLLFSPIAGSLIDTLNPKRIIFLATAIRSVIFIVFTYKLESSYFIFLVSAFTALSFNLNSTSIMKLVKSSVRDEEIESIVYKLASMKNYFLIMGTFFGGLIIHYIGSSNSFLLLSVMSVLSVVPVVSMFYVHKKSKVNIKAMARAGLYYILKDKEIFSLSLLSITNQVIAQITNVMLPVLVIITLNSDSRVYGYIESSWSLGGLAVSLLFSAYIRKVKKELLFFSLLLSGLIITLIPNINNINYAILAHFLLGFLVTFLSVGTYGIITSKCEKEMIGRVLQNTSAGTSLFGLIIYTLPLLLGSENIRLYYYLCASLILLSLSYCFFSRRKHSKILENEEGLNKPPYGNSD